MTDDEAARRNAEWMRRKQRELQEIMARNAEAETDLDAERLTDDERDALALETERRGQPLTRGETFTWLAGYRFMRDF